MNNKNGFYEVAKRITSLNDVGEGFKFKVRDTDIDTIIGVKLIWEFDSDIVLMGGYGGGFGLAFWVNEWEDETDKIYQKIVSEYAGLDFVEFL